MPMQLLLLSLFSLAVEDAFFYRARSIFQRNSKFGPCYKQPSSEAPLHLDTSCMLELRMRCYTTRLRKEQRQAAARAGERTGAHPDIHYADGP